MKRLSKAEKAALGRMKISSAIYDSPLVNTIVDELRRARRQGYEDALKRSVRKKRGTR